MDFEPPTHPAKQESNACTPVNQRSISDALLLHWTISNQTVLLQLQLQPPLEPRVLHRGPKKYPLGPFSVPFWKEKVTSAKLRYTMLSPKQGLEGGVYKREIFSLHFWMNWSIWSTFSIFSKILTKTCRTAEPPPPPL